MSGPAMPATRTPVRSAHPIEGVSDDGGLGTALSLTAFGLNCSLKSSSETSSTDKLVGEVLAALGEHGVSTAGTVRIADCDVRAGVWSDEGDGDEWPALRRQILDADIFVLGTPIWMGHPSSYAQRVLERLDAFLGETDAAGRMVSLDRVAIVAVVGNEDGAHHAADVPAVPVLGKRRNVAAPNREAARGGGAGRVSPVARRLRSSGSCSGTLPRPGRRRTRARPAPA